MTRRQQSRRPVVLSHPRAPGAPIGEVAQRLGVRPDALKRLVEEGAIEAERNGRGGIFFTAAQEGAAVKPCYERGLIRD